jgi:hypothetical protein
MSNQDIILQGQEKNEVGMPIMIARQNFLLSGT